MKTNDDLSKHDIWFVGDIPTATDTKYNRVLGGAEGQLLEEMCDDAGFDWENAARINISKVKYPGWKGLYASAWFCTKTQAVKKGYNQYGEKYIHGELFLEIQELLKEIKTHEPKLIIGLGELPLFALTGASGITNWRGSCLSIFNSKFIPTYAPERIQKNWEWRYIAVQDIKRARIEQRSRAYNFPHERFVIRPNLQEAVKELQAVYDLLQQGPRFIGVDIETRQTHITCIAFAQSRTEAVCIPFVGLTGHYWEEHEELTVLQKIHDILTHPNLRTAGQNFPYDEAYIARWWGIRPTPGMDTMQAWHVVYAGLQKSLAFICSIVLPQYTYWKDENHDAKVDIEGENRYWTYNCKDAARTVALVPILNYLIDAHGLREQYEEQVRANAPHMRVELLGVLRDSGAVLEEMLNETMQLATERATYLESFTEALTGGVQLVKSKNASPWYRSPKQQMKIFYEIYNFKARRDRSTGRPTFDDDALESLKKEEPVLAPLLQALAEYRSLGVFRSTFLCCPLDWDKRMYTSYGVGMTETFRNISKQNAFGYGGNMQNLPSGTEK